MQRLHWQCEDWIGKNGTICRSDATKALARSVWDRCVGLDSHEVGTSVYGYGVCVHSCATTQGACIPNRRSVCSAMGTFERSSSVILGGVDIMAQAVELERVRTSWLRLQVGWLTICAAQVVIGA